MKNLSIVDELDNRQSREQLNIFVKIVNKSVRWFVMFLALTCLCFVTSLLLTIIFKQPIQINLQKLITDGSSNLVANDLWNCLNYILTLHHYISFVAIFVTIVFLFVFLCVTKRVSKQKTYKKVKGAKFEQSCADLVSVFSYKQHVCFLS